MKRLAIALAVLLVALAGIMWRRAMATVGDASATIRVGGRTREYIVHVPASYNGKAALPLVLVLHGATQGDANAERMSGMSTLADKERFLAVYPEGTGRLPTW